MSERLYWGDLFYEIDNVHGNEKRLSCPVKIKLIDRNGKVAGVFDYVEWKTEYGEPDKNNKVKKIGQHLKVYIDPPVTDTTV